MRSAGASMALVLAGGLLAACPGPKREAPKGASAETPAAVVDRPNVLLLTVDTLRADHMGAYGYRRATSPRMDALARRGALFEQAYTYWPKTRGSFVAIMTGRYASQTGYTKTHPLLLDFNPTLASVLNEAGYETVASVDNPNVARSLGYARGFERYRETWEETSLVTEMDRARAITEDGVRFLQAAPRDRPFLVWLHYVNPHAPYRPPSPFDTAFVDADAQREPPLRAVEGFHGGVPRPWASPGKPLGWYVAQYDGEIAAVDAEVGRVLDALESSPLRDTTLVVLTSDHGESLGEHDYYFDHGENLFDPCLRIPLILAGPGVRAGLRSDALVSTLDLVPTILDAVKVSYPPDLVGLSLWRAAAGAAGPAPARLFAQNDRNLMGALDQRYKIVATPGTRQTRYLLYDRAEDPGETRDSGPRQPDRLRVERRELEIFRDRIDGWMVRTRRLLEGRSGEERLSTEACEKLKAMGYVQQGCE